MLERRIALAHLPTPVVALDRLAAALGRPAGTLLAKLDDATGLAGGGNKVRKLEYLCADARGQGCDTLVTGGGMQSNHARLTAAAARRLGFECELVLAGPAPVPPVGNVVLDLLLGAGITWSQSYGFAALEGGIVDRCGALSAEGRRPYPIPIGGSTPLGALGYVRCAQEIRDAVPDVDLVVVASGSGGTHAGLAAGLGSHSMVYGVDVGARPGIAGAVTELAGRTAALAGLAAPEGTARLDDSQIGAGYGAHTDGCRAAMQEAARREGLILDPVYTGKAMAGLIAACRREIIPRDARIVFVHTGGLPALFTPANADWAVARGEGVSAT